MTGSNKEKETRLILQNLRNMLAEYEAATRFGKAPPAWRWWRSDGQAGVVPGGGIDFWRVAYTPADAAVAERPLDAPGDVSSKADGPQDPNNVVRNGCRQLINTQLAMNMLLTVPANNRAFQQMDASRRFTPFWVGNSQTVPAPGGDRALYTNDDGPSVVENVWYFVGSRVIYQGRVYRCIRAHDSTGSSVTPTAGSGTWAEEGLEERQSRLTSSPSAILLDAWNNPILFVPANGLLVRESIMEADRPNRAFTYVVVSPEGSAQPPITGTAGLLVRPGKPFFVSAGPDGNFATMGDNIYSFED
jgi:hypothetical protein